MSVIKEICQPKSLFALLMAVTVILIPYLFWIALFFNFEKNIIIHSLKMGFLFSTIGLFFLGLPALIHYKMRGNKTLNELMVKVFWWVLGVGFVLSLATHIPNFNINDIIFLGGVFALLFLVPTLICAIIYWHLILRQKEQPHGYYKLAALYFLYNFMAINFAGVLMVD